MSTELGESGIARILREPLLHFLVIGGALFAVSTLGEPNEADPPTGDASSVDRAIVIDAPIVARLYEQVAASFGRPPTEDELAAHARGWARDEILFKEALELGLHETDPIVRRRLVQVIGYILEDSVPIEEPTEESLARHLAENPDRFAVPDRVSFEHVFVSGKEEAARRRIDGFRRRLEAGENPQELGDPFPFGPRQQLARATDVRARFGERVADIVFDLAPDEWAGPIESPLGLHLVRVTERREARMPTLDEVRDDVTRSWRRERREAARREAVDAIVAEYDVVVVDGAIEDALAGAPEATEGIGSSRNGSSALPDGTANDAAPLEGEAE